MTYTEFNTSILKLKSFFNEQKKLQNVLNVISPSSTGVCEFGNEFIDDYINLISIAMEDDYNIISWYVFDNDFGMKNLSIILDGEEIIINSNDAVYNYLENIKKYGN